MILEIEREQGWCARLRHLRERVEVALGLEHAPQVRGQIDLRRACTTAVRSLIRTTFWFV